MTTLTDAQRELADLHATLAEAGHDTPADITDLTPTQTMARLIAARKAVASLSYPR